MGRGNAGRRARRDVATPKIRLKMAVADNPHVAAVKSGAIEIAGVDAEFVNVIPNRSLPAHGARSRFDVCELAPTTYIIARALGAPFIALPIFLTRAFHHGGLLVRPRVRHRTPQGSGGQEGRRARVFRDDGAWTPQHLHRRIRLDTSRVTWVVDDEEHVQAMQLPTNVVHAPPGRSLVEMMANGEIEAGFTGNAALAGRAPDVWLGRQQDRAVATYADLFPNAPELEAAWHKKTGIYPMHGTIVRDRERVERASVGREVVVRRVPSGQG